MVNLFKYGIPRRRYLKIPPKINFKFSETVVQLADKPIQLATYTAKNFYTRLGFVVDREQEIFGFTYVYIMVLQPPA